MRVNAQVNFKEIMIVLVLAMIACTAIFALQEKGISTIDNNFFQQNFDLTDISGRELASINKEVSPYTTKKCGEVKHTDGIILTICLATFSGTTGGFYNPEKELMVVGSFSQYTLIHEITHATTLHFYKKGLMNISNIDSLEVQEKMAYNAENLLMQINAFKEDMNITSDLSDAKKLSLGIPVKNKLTVSKDLAKK